ncbi:MAG: GNAT family N-acetyltransferase [Spirochaetales bacterium]|nr:GNAT family N-acetyltransferase [Spirochaetales bacterium]
MVTIVDASLEDAQLLTAITVKAFNDETRRFGSGRDGGPDGYDSVQKTQELILSCPFYKILFLGTTVGALFLKKISPEEFELKSICIDPVYQNIGIGSKVLDLVELMFNEVVLWRLETPCYSVRNHHLYEKKGYVREGESPDGFLYEYVKRCP